MPARMLVSENNGPAKPSSSSLLPGKEVKGHTYSFQAINQKKQPILQACRGGFFSGRSFGRTPALPALPTTLPSFPFFLHGTFCPLTCHLLCQISNLLPIT